jgi:hypothetical protein
MRAYDALNGKVIYDSTERNEVTEEIPHFAAITAGAHSVFCGTRTVLMGFTQRIIH